MWETWVRSLGWEDPLDKEMAAHSSILARKSHGRQSLVGYCPWGHKELDTIEQREEESYPYIFSPRHHVPHTWRSKLRIEEV